jgi:hypothetical protein
LAACLANFVATCVGGSVDSLEQSVVPNRAVEGFVLLFDCMDQAVEHRHYLHAGRRGGETGSRPDPLRRVCIVMPIGATANTVRG